MYRSARKSDLMDTSNPPQAAVHNSTIIDWAFGKEWQNGGRARRAEGRNGGRAERRNSRVAVRMATYLLHLWYTDTDDDDDDDRGLGVCDSFIIVKMHRAYVIGKFLHTVCKNGDKEI